jgi:Tol biopolymer transport system component/DNA-binding winged helix-turn-helix (wHTH) protein
LRSQCASRSKLLKALSLSRRVTVGYSDLASAACMLTPPKSAARVAFGPFEVNASSDELFKHGSRVRLPKQPFQILLILLEQPGELVTREQLFAKVWGDGTFVDFEHSLNAAMNRLRQLLGDSAEKPRYIETIPGRGYRFIGALERQASTMVPTMAESVVREEPPRRSPGLWWALAAALVGLVSLSVWWRFRDAGTGLPSGKMIRLTNDSGLSDSPALSPDGKLLAYSSDRAKAGEMDLYVKQVAGGQPIRLTFDGLGNTHPNFSPDGSRIVFESSRDGGGIYEIRAFGGETRLLARGGSAPVYSPDGSQVAYWVGRGISLWVPGSGAVWVIAVAGGPPRRVAPNLTAGRWPIWVPEGKGKRLLLSGYSSAKPSDPSAMDWWLADANGGEAVRTGIYDALVRAGLQGWTTTYPSGDLPVPGCWSSAGTIIFAVDSGGDTRNLWETGLSFATGKVSGALKRVTVGSGDDSGPSCAPGGNLVFASTQIRRDVWSLPFDLDGGKSKGPLERNTESPARRSYPSLSGDARYVAFASAQSGSRNIWIRELETGKESPVAASSTMVQLFPVISASGSRVSFSTYEKEKRFVYESSPGGVPEKVCEGCIRATDWSRDEKALLVFAGSPFQVNVLDVASHQQTVMLKHPKYSLVDARYSPDNRWVSFTARIEPNRGRIMIAPVDGPKPVVESAWIKIAEEGADDRANWSPDGMTLYFTSARDGYHCLWGQRIDAGSHQPKGDAFAVEHLHGRASLGIGGWSAAGGRIAMVLDEHTGSIWMMSRSGMR